MKMMNVYRNIQILEGLALTFFSLIIKKKNRAIINRIALKLIYLKLNSLLNLFFISFSKVTKKVKLLFYACIWDKYKKLDNK